MREHGVADRSQTAMTQKRGARETHNTVSMMRNRGAALHNKKQHGKRLELTPSFSFVLLCQIVWKSQMTAADVLTADGRCFGHRDGMKQEEETFHPE